MIMPKSQFSKSLAPKVPAHRLSALVDLEGCGSDESLPTGSCARAISGDIGSDWPMRPLQSPPREGQAHSRSRRWKTLRRLNASDHPKEVRFASTGCLVRYRRRMTQPQVWTPFWSRIVGTHMPFPQTGPEQTPNRGVSAPTRFSGFWARAAWERYTGRATRNWAAKSRSK
jgi:hypothetical protein